MKTVYSLTIYVEFRKMAAIIDYIPRVTLSNFKELIKRQAETDKTLFSRFTLKNIQYTVMMSIEEQKLIFFWEHQGTRNQKTIKLHTEPSNLGNGTVQYFLCPYTSHKCRKLFLDGKTIASRYAFSHIYSIQKESRSGRFFYGFGRLEYPVRRYGKQFYRGKTTPYGHKVWTYHKKLEKYNRQLDEYILPASRGRKPLIIK